MRKTFLLDHRKHKASDPFHILIPAEFYGSEGIQACRFECGFGSCQSGSGSSACGFLRGVERIKGKPYIRCGNNEFNHLHPLHNRKG